MADEEVAAVHSERPAPERHDVVEVAAKSELVGQSGGQTSAAVEGHGHRGQDTETRGSGKLRRLRSKPGFWSVIFGSSLLALFIVLALVAPVLAPWSPEVQHATRGLLPPAFLDGGQAAFPLGTDSLGRDILSRIMYGGRISLLIGAAAVVGAGVLGTGLGVLSGYLRGWVDYCLQRVMEVFQTFPFLLLGILVMAFLGQGIWKLVLVLVLTRWVQFCRVARAETLREREREYALASKTIGGNGIWIVCRHIVPNIMTSLVIVATFSFAFSIIAAASLSFLGLGVPPQVATWGTMLSNGRNFMFSDPWLSVLPGLALFLTVIGANVLGDGIRDMTDPRLRGRR